MKIVPSKHFLEQMQSRNIKDLSLCGYILLEISKNPHRNLKDFEESLKQSQAKDLER